MTKDFWEPNIISKLGKATLMMLLLFVLLGGGMAVSAEIKWDKSTLTLVQPGGHYARMIRLKSGAILCCFSKANKACLKKSLDDGKTWGELIIAAGKGNGGAANAEILELNNGSILYLYNERPKGARDPGGSKYPFTIKMCKSKDEGATWSKPKELYAAGNEFKNGCWEPVATQLPDGEVQVFFANEGPYRKSSEQEITLLRSKDNGETWSDPEKIIFRAGHRDGMPCPLVLKDNKGIVVAIEDNGLNGRFKPVIAYTSMKDNWRNGFVSGDSDCRWPALKERLPKDVKGGAPYIRQMPSGNIVLSFQTAKPKSDSKMIVYVGDSDAKNFDNPSFPFDVEPLSPQRWNSLFVKNKDTVTAISETVIDDKFGIWAIDGTIKE